MDNLGSVDDNQLTDEALHLMMPQHVVNCLVSAGFDKLSVLSMMDVSNNKGNSIEEVEDYVSKDHPEWLPNGRFSPGHRLCIQMFIEEIQKSCNPKVTVGKGKRVCEFSPGHRLRIQMFMKRYKSLAILK